jgi:hypothetical protein
LIQQLTRIVLDSISNQESSTVSSGAVSELAEEEEDQQKESEESNQNTQDIEESLTQLLKYEYYVTILYSQ